METHTHTQSVVFIPVLFAQRGFAFYRGLERGFEWIAVCQTRNLHPEGSRNEDPLSHRSCTALIAHREQGLKYLSELMGTKKSLLGVKRHFLHFETGSHLTSFL